MPSYSRNGKEIMQMVKFEMWKGEPTILEIGSRNTTNPQHITSLI